MKRLSPTGINFLKKVEEILKHFEDEASLKNITMYLLKTFILCLMMKARIFILSFRNGWKRLGRFFS